MIQTFKNIEHQKSFEEDGYLVLDLISKEVLSAIQQLFDKNYFHTDNPRSNFNAVSDEEKTTHIRLESTRLLGSCFDLVFDNYINHGATFFTKDKHHGELGLHQDLTIVDFPNSFACYSWIPLHDVTKENGCICLIEKSHLYFQNFISFTYKNENITLDSVPAQSLKILEMKAGEVLFFDNRLFHGSFPNQTEVMRVAINSLITSKESPLVYYQKKDDNTASEYFVTADAMANSYRTFSQGLLPDGAVFSKDIAYVHTSISYKELRQAIAANNKSNLSIFNRFKKVLGY